MKAIISPFRLPKEGNSQKEYEDACLPTRRIERELTTIRVAVADGATESSFAQHWARLLVSAFVRGKLSPESPEDESGLRSLQQQWAARVRKRPLPWYAEQKAQLGAFAAFVGLDFPEIEASRIWNAWGAGDSCLMQVRNDDVALSWPLDKAEHFEGRPCLLSSNPDMNGPEPFKKNGGQWEHGDRFYLMTDALACWYIKNREAGGKPWGILDSLADRPEVGAFGDFISDLRDKKKIRNDDVTLIRILLP